MKYITIAVTLSLLFALESAFGAEGKAAAATDDGMKIAEQLLLQEDVEQVPAKEEKVEQKKRAMEEPGDAPLTNDAVDGEEGLSSPAGVLKAVGDDDAAQSKPAGSLGYEMDTVDMLADAPAEPGFEKAPAEASVAKR